MTGWAPYGNNGAWVADLLLVPQERCENYDQDTGHSCAHPTTPEHHCMVNSTDCWQSGTRWFTRADKDPQVSARFLANANPSLVDAEGEYFFDRSAGKVYIKPFGGINPNNVDIECSVRAVAPLMHEFAQYWPAGYSPGDNMTIQNLHFEHSNRNALTLNNFENIKILGNQFTNNSGGESCRSNPAAIIVHKSSCGGAYPLPCSCYNNGLEIRDNIVSHQGSDVGPGRGQCIETYHTNNSIIDGNILSDCGTGIYTKSGHCGGFVSNNFVSQYDNAFQIQSNVFGISIMNNIATEPRSGARFMYYTGSSQGNRVCNNTVLGSDAPSDGIAARFDNGIAVVKGNYFGNNLREPLIQSDGGTFPDSNHNFFQGSTVARGYQSLSTWQSATGNDMNSEQVPYSKSAPPIAASNGVISAGSPLIDQGAKIDGYHCSIAGVQDFPGCRVWYGTAPDAGAYEYKP